MNVFSHDSYCDLLKAALLDRKERRGRAFTCEKMAQACRVQRTYLSAVLGGRGHLNADQVFDAAQFLEFSETEYAFVSALHERERSVSPVRQKRLDKLIKDLRQQGLRTDTVITAPAQQSALSIAMTAFYLDINAQLIHMFLTIPRFREDRQKIARALGFGTEFFDAALKKIERAGLVRLSSLRAIEILQDAFHLPANSELFPTYRQNMRLKALDFMQSRSTDKHFSFSALFSAREETRTKIQLRFLEFIDWAQKLSQDDAPTDVFQMNFDLLHWS